MILLPGVSVKSCEEETTAIEVVDLYASLTTPELVSAFVPATYRTLPSGEAREEMLDPAPEKLSFSATVASGGLPRLPMTRSTRGTTEAFEDSTLSTPTWVE